MVLYSIYNYDLVFATLMQYFATMKYINKYINLIKELKVSL